VKPARRIRGFTLLEVLVALIVVALGMSAALSALSSAADSVARLRDRTFAQWIAFNQVSLARLALQMPAEGTTSGAVEDFANGKWKWSQTIKQLDTPGIFRVQVRVRHDTTADDEHAEWLADVSGFRGTALAAASGEQPNWNGTPPAGNQPNCTQRNAQGQCIGSGSSSSASSESSSSSGASSSQSSSASSGTGGGLFPPTPGPPVPPTGSPTR
jgi:general secretion pathway protein I